MAVWWRRSAVSLLSAVSIASVKACVSEKEWSSREMVRRAANWVRVSSETLSTRCRPGPGPWKSGSVRALYRRLMWNRRISSPYSFTAERKRRSVLAKVKIQLKGLPCVSTSEKSWYMLPYAWRMKAHAMGGPRAVAVHWLKMMARSRPTGEGACMAENLFPEATPLTFLENEPWAWVRLYVSILAQVSDPRVEGTGSH